MVLKWYQVSYSTKESGRRKVCRMNMAIVMAGYNNVFLFLRDPNVYRE